jgi:dTDP-4-amino-4,6-dideoxygalactose transaminase
MFLMQIPYFRPPYANYSEIEPKIQEIVDSRVYTKGAYRSLLEARLSHYLGVDHAITCASGTSALYIAMRVMRKNLADEHIAMPAFNWASDRISADAAGYKTVYVDIDPDTWLPVPRHGYVDAHLALDTFGSIDRQDYRGSFIVDATHSVGIKGIWDRGLACCGSMAPTKNLTSGEGGFITTNDHDFALKCAELRDLCARLPEMSCVLAIESLSHLDDRIKEKRKIAAYYHKHLPYQFQEIPHDSTHSKICFLCDNSDELIAKAAAAGVECRKYYKPLWGMPNSGAVYDRIVCLPAYVGVDAEAVTKLIHNADSNPV